MSLLNMLNKIGPSPDHWRIPFNNGSRELIYIGVTNTSIAMVYQ